MNLSPELDYKYVMVGFSKWKFINSKERLSLINNVIRKNIPVFETIHNYSEDQEQRECPIYMDLDGKKAEIDLKKILRKFYEVFDTYPKVWYSGSKGYHIVLPCYIKGKEPEKIVKYIVKNIFDKRTIDTCVYGSKRMWRIEGSVNEKTGKKKERIFEFLQCIPENINMSVVRTLIDSAAIKIEKEYKNHIPSGDPDKEMVPCISSIINGELIDGQKHNSIMYAALFWKYHNGDKGELINRFLQNNNWLEHEEHIKRTIYSVFASNRENRFGCNNEILRSKCEKYCKFYRK